MAENVGMAVETVRLVFVAGLQQPKLVPEDFHALFCKTGSSFAPFSGRGSAGSFAP